MAVFMPIVEDENQDGLLLSLYYQEERMECRWTLKVVEVGVGRLSEPAWQVPILVEFGGWEFCSSEFLYQKSFVAYLSPMLISMSSSSIGRRGFPT